MIDKCAVSLMAETQCAAPYSVYDSVDLIYISDLSQLDTSAIHFERKITSLNSDKLKSFIN